MGKRHRLVEQREDLARVAFSGDVFSALLNLFPYKEQLKMCRAAETKERMEDILAGNKKKEEFALLETNLLRNTHRNMMV